MDRRDDPVSGSDPLAKQPPGKRIGIMDIPASPQTSFSLVPSFLVLSFLLTNLTKIPRVRMLSSATLEPTM
jgi:hypothetical protein